MKSVNRSDRSDLGKVERTPQGGLRIPAFLTRVGVLDYQNADGSLRRELRHPDEVFKADSLATLEDAPVTDLHPKRMVDGGTFKVSSVGHVKGLPKQDGDKIASILVVQDGTTVAAIERRDRTQVSCGYRCDLDFTPGVYEGKHYDARQMNIEYNHVAIVPRGRAGAEVALRLDSEDNEDTTDEEDQTTMKLIHIDGRDIEYGSAQHIDAVTAQGRTALVLVQTRLDTALAEVVTEKKRADTAEGLVVALKKECDPKRIDELVTARAGLLGIARGVLGADVKLDGLTERGIKEKIITRLDASVKFDGKSDDYVQGIFDRVASRVDSSTGLEGARLDLFSAENADNFDLDTLDNLDMDMSGAHGRGGAGGWGNPGGGQGLGVATPARQAWQQPLAGSKDAR